MTLAARWRWLPPVVLLGLALLIAAARLHTYHEPYERDIMGVAVIGHELVAGRALYADMWDHKPPAFHVTYAAAELLAGYGPGMIYLLSIVASIVTLLGVYAATTAPGYGAVAGLWAAGFWAVISGDLWLEANEPNTEVFINAALVWAWALLARAYARPSGAGRFVTIGALFALASLYKTIAVAPAALLAGAYVACPPAPFHDRRRALLHVAIMAAIGAAAWGLLAAAFASTGHYRDFYDALFTFNRYYAHSISANLAKSVTLTFLVPPFFTIVMALAGLAAVGLAVGALKGPRGPWLSFVALVAGTHLAVALPGHFHPHYYQLWLPVLIVGAGWAVGALGGLRRLPGWAPHMAAGAALVLLVVWELPTYKVPAEDWSRLKHGEIFIASEHLGREISRFLEPEERLYQWGSEMGIYYAARRRPASGVFYVYPLIYGPLAHTLSRRVIADFTRTPPELFVLVKWAVFEGRLKHPVLDWIGPRYRPLPDSADRGYFALFIRKGGALERRIDLARGM